MTTFTLTYDENAALSVGQSQYIDKTGAYIIKIDEAQIKHSPSGARFLEFSGETEDGMKINYLSVCINKINGTPNTWGLNLVHAIMGCAGLTQIAEKRVTADHAILPGFSGKTVGMVLQKVLRTKKNGDDMYLFEIRLPFFARTHQTLSEQKENRPPEAIEKWVSSLKDKDERGKSSHPPGSLRQNFYAQSKAGNVPLTHANTAKDFDDDIPF